MLKTVGRRRKDNDNRWGEKCLILKQQDSRRMQKLMVNGLQQDYTGFGEI